MGQSRESPAEKAYCVGCAEIFERPLGRGRPRLYCPVCVPPVGLVGMAEAARRWRELNPAAVERYNHARRVVHDPRPCSECGEQFTPGRRDATVCSKRCRWRRSRRLQMKKAAA